MKFYWSMYDELVKAVEARLPSHEMHGVTVEQIVLLTLSLAFMASVYGGEIKN